MTGTEPIRVIVADDQELVRTGFCVILEATDGITVVAEAANGAEAVQAAAKHHPDVILMDVRMPEMDGLEATRLITGGDRAGPPRVVMLTTFDFDDYVYEALRSGASGFLLKDAPRHDLISAIKVAAAGNALLAPSVTMRLIDAFARRPPETLPAPVAAGVADRQEAGHPAPPRPRADQRGDSRRPGRLARWEQRYSRQRPRPGL